MDCHFSYIGQRLKAYLSSRGSCIQAPAHIYEALSRNSIRSTSTVLYEHCVTSCVKVGDALKQDPVRKKLGIGSRSIHDVIFGEDEIQVFEQSSVGVPVVLKFNALEHTDVAMHPKIVKCSVHDINNSVLTPTTEHAELEANVAFIADVVTNKGENLGKALGRLLQSHGSASPELRSRFRPSIPSPTMNNVFHPRGWARKAIEGRHKYYKPSSQSVFLISQIYEAGEKNKDHRWTAERIQYALFSDARISFADKIVLRVAKIKQLLRPAGKQTRQMLQKVRESLARASSKAEAGQADVFTSDSDESWQRTFNQETQSFGWVNLETGQECDSDDPLNIVRNEEDDELSSELETREERVLLQEEFEELDQLSDYFEGSEASSDEDVPLTVSTP